MSATWIKWGTTRSTTLRNDHSKGGALQYHPWKGPSTVLFMPTGGLALCAGLSAWRGTASSRRALRKLLSVGVAAYATHLLAAAVAHWRLHRLHRLRTRSAFLLCQSWHPLPTLLRTMIGWQDCVARGVAQHLRDAEIMTQLRSAAESVGGAALPHCKALPAAVPSGWSAWQHCSGAHASEHVAAPSAKSLATQRQGHPAFGGKLSSCRQLQCIADARTALLAAVKSVAAYPLLGHLRFRATAACVLWAANIRRFVPDISFPLLTSTPTASRCAPHTTTATTLSAGWLWSVWHQRLSTLTCFAGEMMEHAEIVSLLITMTAHALCRPVRRWMTSKSLLSSFMKHPPPSLTTSSPSEDTSSSVDCTTARVVHFSPQTILTDPCFIHEVAGRHSNNGPGPPGCSRSAIAQQQRPKQCCRSADSCTSGHHGPCSVQRVLPPMPRCRTSSASVSATRHRTPQRQICKPQSRSSPSSEDPLQWCAQAWCWCPHHSFSTSCRKVSQEAAGPGMSSPCNVDQKPLSHIHSIGTCPAREPSHQRATAASHAKARCHSATAVCAGSLLEPWRSGAATARKQVRAHSLVACHSHRCSITPNEQATAQRACRRDRLRRARWSRSESSSMDEQQRSSLARNGTRGRGSGHDGAEEQSGVGRVGGCASGGGWSAGECRWPQVQPKHEHRKHEVRTPASLRFLFFASIFSVGVTTSYPSQLALGNVTCTMPVTYLNSSARAPQQLHSSSSSQARRQRHAGHRGAPCCA
jgi:hypothetical protein